MKSLRQWIGVIIIVTLLLSSCAAPTAQPTATATAAVTPTPHPPTATSGPPPVSQRLVLCATEPLAASPFAPSPAGNDLLALFFEEPVERVGYRWEARLIEAAPTLEAGDVITRMAPVPTGSRYVDDTGAIQTYTGGETLSLPQLVVTFTLKSGLLWSDGEPLTADDVSFGYLLAQSPQAQGRWCTLVERTSRFVALDAQTLRWEGIPGYLSTDYPGFLFPPQPVHRWREQTLAQILQDRTPLATGPFQIVAWEAGREVRLEPNPHYAGPAPKLQEVVFRFPQIEARQWSELLLSGECDVLLPDPVMSTDWRQWATLGSQGYATIWADTAPVVLRLDFNIAPVDKAPSPLTDLRVRLGLSHCIDRGRLSKALPGEALIPADSFVPPGHPAFNADVTARITYDPEAGGALMEEVGWRDEDGDGIREAHDVAGFTDGTPLSLTLHLAPQYMVSAAHIAADLESCGVGISPQPTEVQLLYASDAVSPLFGRTFQMALFGWQTEFPQICGAWLSDRIPGKDNAWTGENFSGYASEAYDVACQRALTAVAEQVQWAALREAQALIAEDLPTLFLTWRPFWFVARPQVRGLQPDASTYGAIWNVEALSMGE